jgi:patatin-like phospholipase/acyl hydrolase
LKVIEDKYCKPQGTTLLDHFDMFCGTSTGGIIALGLANRMKVDQIIKIYDDNVTKIFPPLTKFNNVYSTIGLGLLGSGLTFLASRNPLYTACVGFTSLFLPYLIDFVYDKYRQVKGYKYDSKAIKNIATEHFGDMKMNELSNLVCIPSYEIGTANNRVFKFPHSGMERDKNVMVKDAIMSTTCAPTYFPVHKVDNGGLVGGYFVDGGIWANNPFLVGIIETLQYFVGKDKQYDKYEMLSIGNINYNKNPIPESETGRKSFWNALNFEMLINVMFDSNSKSISHFCNVISKTNDCVYKRLECKNFSCKFGEKCELDSSDAKVFEQYKSHGNTDGYNFTTEQNAEYKDLKDFLNIRKHMTLLNKMTRKV